MNKLTRSITYVPPLIGTVIWLQAYYSEQYVSLAWLFIPPVWLISLSIYFINDALKATHSYQLMEIMCHGSHKLNEKYVIEVKTTGTKWHNTDWITHSRYESIAIAKEELSILRKEKNRYRKQLIA